MVLPMKTAHAIVALVALSFLLLTPTLGLAADEAGTVKTVKLSIEGMCCAGCLPDIEKSLSSVKGVQSAKATYEPPQAVVTYDSAKATTKQLIAAIGKVGYGAKVKPNEKKDS